MKQFLIAKENCWLTQSEINEFRPRVFLKTLPVNNPENWTNWTDEQYKEYVRENGEQTIFDLIKYSNNFPIKSVIDVITKKKD